MYDHNNIFAKILRGEIPSKKVFESDFTLAFEDINKQAKHHILIIPKGAYINFYDFNKNATKEEVLDFFNVVTSVIESIDSKNGYRIISNAGENGGQEVAHMHFHILAGEPLGKMLCK